MSAIDGTGCALDKLKSTGKKMNGINTHVVDSANCSKQLKFGVDRILSNEICAKKTDVFKPLPIQMPSIRCPCVGSCGRCEALRACTSFPHAHSSLPEGVTPAPYIGIMESLGTLYRPAPLRPVPRTSISSSSTMSSSETSTRRKRSWSRAVFSSLQRKGLERRFSLQKYITKPDRRQLAATLGLTDAQVVRLGKFCQGLVSKSSDEMATHERKREPCLGWSGLHAEGLSPESGETYRHDAARGRGGRGD
ncbi:H2.0-like homeobox protein isoform X1 [Odontomachus brunneus]|uniref:H2.0-like homeobox protein isoform X1 n=1 Tax=Odontomachus brunneus TaxID=486640 RepID=UPI0013F1A3BB|nr:H2.0-like homeobox protein isoform X1 [Odontomachus brunneus]